MKLTLKDMLAVLGVVLVSSCTKTETEPIEKIIAESYDYYPVEVGFWQEYNVEKTTWNDFDHSVNYHTYQLKEMIESQFLAGNGDTLYRVECYERENETQQWAIQRVCFLRKDNKSVLRNEENLTFCKMIFPLQENSTWNEYLYIDSTVFYTTHYPNTSIISLGVKYQNASLEFYKQPQVINDQYFEDCVGVNLHSYQTTINEDTEKEYYAKGVGLVYQYVNHTEKTAIGGEFVTNKGYILEKKIADYKR